MDIDVVDMLHRPEYTGENRCKPCTVLNLLLAVIFCSGLARMSRFAGYTFFIVSIGLIYFRGYLVPGTPTLTKRYLPPRVLRWFGKEPELNIQNGLGVSNSDNRDNTSEPLSKTDQPTGTIEDVDPHEHLLTENVLKPCEDRDDLCLNTNFRNIWKNEIATLADSNFDATDAICMLDVETHAEEVKIKEYGNAWVLVAGSQTVGKWPSYEALLADIGAARVLTEWSEYWESMTPAQKGEVLNSLRLFIEQCPGRNESVSINQETVESCCSSYEVIVASCDESGARIFEQQLN